MQEGNFPGGHPVDADRLRDERPVEERSVAEYPPILVPVVAEAAERPKKVSRPVSQEAVETIKASLGKSIDAKHLSAELEDLNGRLRELRLERKSVDTWAAKIFPAARARLMNLDTSIDLIKAQRDEIETTFEAMLPAEQRVTTRTERVQAAREKMGEELAKILPARELGDRRHEVSRKDQLRADRLALSEESASLRFWQFGRKREIVEEMKAIDREMAGIINVERGR